MSRPLVLLLSERFVSLQGEGASLGAPAAFVRLARCNLTCTWCDTPYSWDFERYDFEQEVKQVPAEELIQWLLEHSPGRIIWTGGEPLVQQKQLAATLSQLDAARWARGEPLDITEVETNGTVRPLPELLARIDQWNVSPKLASSGEPVHKRIHPQTLTLFQSSGRAYFKFVVQPGRDEQEILELLRELELPRERVLLMPEARTASELRERSLPVAELALRERTRFSSRLHLELYGGKRGT